MISCSHAKLLSRPHTLMLSCSCSVALMTPGHQRSSDHDHMMSMEQMHDTALTNQGQTYAKDMTIAVRRALGGLRRDVRCDMRGAKQKSAQVCVSTVQHANGSASQVAQGVRNPRTKWDCGIAGSGPSRAKVVQCLCAVDHSYCALQTQAIAQPFSLSLPGAMPGAPGIACAARTSTMVAISDVAIALIGGRGGAVATQNVLKPHVEQLNAQTPCARGNARGPWVAGHYCWAWVRAWGSGHECGHRAAAAPSEHAGARTTAVFWHCLCYC